MLNPLRSEDAMFRVLLYVIAAFVVILVVILAVRAIF